MAADGSFGGAVLQILEVSRLRNAEEQLRRAAKMQSLSLLAGSLAHDLNNVFTALVGYSSLLRKPGGLPPGRQTHALEMLEKAAASGAKMVENLLGFTSERSASLPAADFDSAFRQACALFSCGLPEEVVLHVRSSLSGVNVRGSATKVEQVILNLALNARDAVLPKGGTVSISAAKVDSAPSDCLIRVTTPPRGFVEVTVDDNGQGIPHENLGLIFDPYFTTKQPGRGTGLGLSSVWGILRESGGSIRVESEPGKGTRVQFYLPIISPEEVVIAERVQVMAPVAGAGQRVLLVEPDPALSELLVWVMLRNGYKALHCSSMMAAYDIINRTDAIDAVILEEQWTGEYWHKVVTLAIERGLAIVQLTTRAPGASGPAGRMVLAHKPFSPEQFLTALGTALSIPPPPPR